MLESPVSAWRPTPGSPSCGTDRTTCGALRYARAVAKRADEDELTAELLRLVVQRDRLRRRIRAIRRALSRIGDEREIRFIDDLLGLP